MGLSKTSIYSKLEQDEILALKKIEQAGYNSPYNKFRAALETGDNKRYVVDLRTVKYGDIEENQVSVDVIFKTRCTEELQPLIEMQGLQHPPIVEETSIPGKYKQVTGHHRAYTMDMIQGSVPVVVVTKNYNLKGGQVSPDIDLIQGIRSNPRQENRSYSMDDAVLMIQKSLRLNPFQDGENPSGKLPPRTSDDKFDFDDLMNRLYGPYGFPNKAIRTKIFNRVRTGAVASKLIDIDDSEQTNHLTRIGWDPGLKSSGKRKDSVDHFDTSRNCIIIVSDDNGQNFDGRMMNVFKKYHTDSEYKQNLEDNNIDFIDVAGRIYKPPTDKTSLDQKRSYFKKVVQRWNEIFPKANVSLKIRYLALPKQLKVNDDTDKLFDVR